MGGILQIFEGANNANHPTQSVRVVAASVNDLDIEIASQSLNGVNTDALLLVTNTTVNDNTGLLGAFIQDSGAGNDTLILGGGSGANDPFGPFMNLNQWYCKGGRCSP